MSQDGHAGQGQRGAAANASPGMEFLGACLRTAWDPAAGATACRLAAGALDWTVLRRAAQLAGVAPALYALLKQEAFGSLADSQPHGALNRLIPHNLTAWLASAYYANARRNALFLHQLEELLCRLSAAGIPAMVPDAAALLEDADADVGAYVLAELDLVVNRPDAAAALQVLRHTGYQARRPEGRKGVATCCYHEGSLERLENAPVVVGIRWDGLPSPRFGRILWQTARPGAVGDAAYLLPGIEAQTLYLAIGAAEAGDGKVLLRRYDLARWLLGHGTHIAWPRLAAQAQAAGLVCPLRLALQDLIDWRVPVPDEAARQLAALRPGRREGFAEACAARAGQSPAFRWLAHLASGPRWLRRPGYAWARLLLPPAPAPARSRPHGLRPRHAG